VKVSSLICRSLLFQTKRMLRSHHRRLEKHQGQVSILRVIYWSIWCRHQMRQCSFLQVSLLLQNKSNQKARHSHQKRAFTSKTQTTKITNSHNILGVVWDIRTKNLICNMIKKSLLFPRINKLVRNILKRNRKVGNVQVKDKEIPILVSRKRT
jgi:hypothetical protein